MHRACFLLSLLASCSAWSDTKLLLTQRPCYEPNGSNAPACNGSTWVGESLAAPCDGAYEFRATPSAGGAALRFSTGDVVPLSGGGTGFSIECRQAHISIRADGRAAGNGTGATLRIQVVPAAQNYGASVAFSAAAPGAPAGAPASLFEVPAGTVSVGGASFENTLQQVTVLDGAQRAVAFSAAPKKALLVFAPDIVVDVTALLSVGATAPDTGATLAPYSIGTTAALPPKATALRLEPIEWAYCATFACLDPRQTQTFDVLRTATGVGSLLSLILGTSISAELRDSTLVSLPGNLTAAAAFALATRIAEATRRRVPYYTNGTSAGFFVSPLTSVVVDGASRAPITAVQVFASGPAPNRSRLYSAAIAVCGSHVLLASDDVTVVRESGVNLRSGPHAALVWSGIALIAILLILSLALIISDVRRARAKRVPW